MLINVKNLALANEGGRMVKHKWKQFAEILNCPYSKRFSTNGWGDFRIDSKGLYSYEDKEYCDDGGLICLFLSGEIERDKALDSLIGDIMIYEKYYALNKRCKR